MSFILCWFLNYKRHNWQVNYLFWQKPIGGVAVLPAGGLFNKKDKENRDVNTPNQNGLDANESQLNSSGDSDKLKDKSKVSLLLLILVDQLNNIIYLF